MAEKKGFEKFEPIFGEAEAKVESDSKSFGRLFLFYVHYLDSSRLEIVVSDFHSHTFAQILTVYQLDDLRDDVGIGGSWSDFVDYLITSLSLGKVTLTLDGSHNIPIDLGAQHAKLIAHRSKGLPRIALPLSKAMNSSTSDAMANFSLALFRAFKDKQNNSMKEHECFLQMKGLLSSEKERSESLQKQLDSLSFVKKRKVQKSKASDKTSFVPDSSMDNNTVIANYIANGEQPSKDTQPTKASQKSAPTSRRTRTRGVSLKDIEVDDD